MKVKKSDNYKAPGYPSKKQIMKSGALLGAATLGLATVTSGCARSHRIVGVPPPYEESIRTGGIPAYEPKPDSQTNVYVIHPGDTLYGLAQCFLGKGERWNEIVQANPGLEPTKLKIGQTITIPTQ